MRNVFILLTLFSFLASCTNGNKNRKDDPSDKNTRKQAVKVAEIFAKKQLPGAKRSVSETGIVVLSSNSIQLLIDPSKIVSGKINNDSITDVIVPVYNFRNQALTMTEQLILINEDGRLILKGVSDKEMKIIAIKDGIIFAEISKVASDSPNFGCNLCKEIVKYRFTGDSLSKIK